MIQKNKVEIALKEFLKLDKFLEFNYLQPSIENSSKENKAIIDTLVGNCCKEIISYLQPHDATSAGVKKILIKTLQQINDASLDSEEKEFGYELLVIIADKISVKIAFTRRDIEEKMLKRLNSFFQQPGVTRKK